jgi:transcription-repair coupling factor (superfamily II helicase)
MKIPESFMPEVGDRLALYKRLSVTQDSADVDRIQAETEDRWGHLGPAGRNLFDMTRLRIASERAGLKSVDAVGGVLQLRFTEDARPDPQRVIGLIGRRGGSMTPSGMVSVPAPDRPGERIGAVRAILEEIRSDESPDRLRPGGVP